MQGRPGRRTRCRASSAARPTPAEIAERTGASLEQVLEAREASAAYRAVSLDRPRTDDEEEGDSYADAFGAEDPGFRLAEDAATVERLMRVLSEREREVLRLRFEEDLTQSEIGAARRRLPDARLAPDPPVDRAPARRGRRRPTEPAERVSSAPWSTGTCARSTCSRTSRRSCTRRAASRGRSRSTCPRASASRTTRCTSARTWSWSTARSRSTPTAAASRGGPGFVAVFDPQERHEVRATSDARLLLVLAPWPGEGHPGARDD